MLFYTLAVGSERLFGSFISSYSVDSPLSFSHAQAADLVSAFFFAHMIGRFLGIFISHLVPIQMLVLVDLILAVVVAVVGCVFAYDNARVLWAVTVCAGALLSLLYPCGIAWVNMYLQVRPRADSW